MRFVMSFILGLLPETLYLTLFFICCKNIKEKRIFLFILISICYMVLILFKNYVILNYILMIFLLFGCLKILYKEKTQIIDIFIINVGLIYLTLVGFITSRFVNNSYVLYYVMYAINRILLFVPFIFKNKFNVLYKKYCSLWNRNYEKKQPIKSITLRNVSLIILNIFVFIMNIISVSMTNFMK